LHFLLILFLIKKQNLSTGHSDKQKFISLQAQNRTFDEAA